MNSINSGNVQNHPEQCSKLTHRTERHIRCTDIFWGYVWMAVSSSPGYSSPHPPFRCSLKHLCHLPHLPPLIPSLFSFPLSSPTLSYHIWLVIWPMCPNQFPCSSLSLFEGFPATILTFWSHGSGDFTPLHKHLWWFPIAYRKQDWVSDRHLGDFHHLPSFACFCLPSSSPVTLGCLLDAFIKCLQLRLSVLIHKMGTIIDND